MDNLRSLPAAWLAFFFFGTNTFSAAQPSAPNGHACTSNALIINVLDCEMPDEKAAVSEAPPIENSTERESQPLPNLEFQLFPNPCSDFVEVRPNGVFDSGSQLLLFDARGTEIRRFDLEPSGRRLETGGLPSGVYFLGVACRGRGMVVRVLVVGA